MKHSQSRLPLGRVGAALFLLGSWQGSEALLLGIVAAAVVAALFFWFSRRRRQEADSGSLLKTSAPADLGATQIEGLSESGSPAQFPPAAASPGLHGKIEVQVGGQLLSTYLVTDHPLPIGRDPAQSLVIIQEPIVSKLHCQVFVRGGQVFVRDCKSTNGIYVNDEKVDECPLADNTQVFLGRKGTVRIVYHR